VKGPSTRAGGLGKQSAAYQSTHRLFNKASYCTVNKLGPTMQDVAGNQCSGSAFDGRLDPDPYSELRSGSRRPKKGKKGRKNASKRQIIRHKKNKKQCNWYKMGKYYFIFIKS
jgi:hypothetical protein